MLVLAPYIRHRWPRVWFYAQYLRSRLRAADTTTVALRHLVPRGRLAIDVGSSIGLHARELAWFTPRVMAFEANPEVAAFAKTVASRKIKVVNVALSDQNGRVRLRIPLNTHGDTIDDRGTIAFGNSFDGQRYVSVEVESRRLDDYDLPDCGFIKIDVEGHEAAVLDGAETLVQRAHPVLMIELDEALNPGTIRRMTTRLSQQSYDVYFLSRGELLPLSEFRIELHQNMDAYVALPPRVRRQAEYINNFIFIPREMRPPAILRRRKSPRGLASSAE